MDKDIKTQVHDIVKNLPISDSQLNEVGLEKRKIDNCQLCDGQIIEPVALQKFLNTDQ